MSQFNQKKSFIISLPHFLSCAPCQPSVLDTFPNEFLITVSSFPTYHSLQPSSSSYCIQLFLTLISVFYWTNPLVFQIAIIPQILLPTTCSVPYNTEHELKLEDAWSEFRTWLHYIYLHQLLCQHINTGTATAGLRRALPSHSLSLLGTYSTSPEKRVRNGKHIVVPPRNDLQQLLIRTSRRWGCILMATSLWWIFLS